MIPAPIIILASLTLFIAIVIHLALKPKYTSGILQFCAFGALLLGMILYGSSYAAIGIHPLLAVLRTILSVCGMFVGKNDLSAISAAPMTNNSYFQLIFWCSHLMALYATASAAIATLGANIIKQFRLWLLGHRDLIIIYGVNDTSIAIAKRCHRQDNVSILLVDDVIPAQYMAEIDRYGFIPMTDSSATKPDSSFIRKYCRSNHRLTVYALHKDNFRNMNYADNFCNRLEYLKITSSKYTLILKSPLESLGDHLILKKDKSGKILHYGFAFVYIYSDSQLVARTLLKKYPISNYMTFDHEKCLATSNNDVIIIGFGEMGQNVLREVIRNSQILGSQLHIAIFEHHWEEISGPIEKLYPGLFEAYNIDFYNCGANSNTFYSYLSDHRDTLNYITVCSGSEKSNGEIATKIMQYTQFICPATPIFQCYETGIKAFGEDLTSFSNWSHYENLFEIITDKDLLAKTLNYYYTQDTTLTADEAWMSCSYQNRMSSRASTDFFPTMLKIMGKSEEEVLGNGLNLTEEQLLNLGKTEHLRWNAFMYSMGYRKMTEEEYQKRTELYQQAMEEGKPAPFRIGNNPRKKTHACLITWEELVDLSLKESSITGNEIDYQQMDINNVTLIPVLLKLKKKQEGHS